MNCWLLVLVSPCELTCTVFYKIGVLCCYCDLLFSLLDNVTCNVVLLYYISLVLSSGSGTQHQHHVIYIDE